MCVCVCTYIHVSVHIHQQTHTCVRTWAYIHTRTEKCSHMYQHKRVHTYTCTQIYTGVRIWACQHTIMQTDTHRCKNMSAHTHKHTKKYTRVNEHIRVYTYIYDQIHTCTQKRAHTHYKNKRSQVYENERPSSYQRATKHSDKSTCSHACLCGEPMFWGEQNLCVPIYIMRMSGNVVYKQRGSNTYLKGYVLFKGVLMSCKCQKICHAYHIQKGINTIYKPTHLCVWTKAPSAYQRAPKYVCTHLPHADVGKHMNIIFKWVLLRYLSL